VEPHGLMIIDSYKIACMGMKREKVKEEESALL
jgi:hypothetical protein